MSSFSHPCLMRRRIKSMSSCYRKPTITGMSSLVDPVARRRSQLKWKSRARRRRWRRGSCRGRRKRSSRVEQPSAKEQVPCLRRVTLPRELLAAFLWKRKGAVEMILRRMRQQVRRRKQTIWKRKGRRKCQRVIRLLKSYRGSICKLKGNWRTSRK